MAWLRSFFPSRTNAQEDGTTEELPHISLIPHDEDRPLPSSPCGATIADLLKAYQRAIVSKTAMSGPSPKQILVKILCVVVDNEADLKAHALEGGGFPRDVLDVFCEATYEAVQHALQIVKLKVESEFEPSDDCDFMVLCLKALLIVCFSHFNRSILCERGVLNQMVKMIGFLCIRLTRSLAPLEADPSVMHVRTSYFLFLEQVTIDGISISLMMLGQPGDSLWFVDVPARYEGGIGDENLLVPVPVLASLLSGLNRINARQPLLDLECKLQIQVLRLLEGVVAQKHIAADEKGTKAVGPLTDMLHWPRAFNVSVSGKATSAVSTSTVMAELYTQIVAARIICRMVEEDPNFGPLFLGCNLVDHTVHFVHWIFEALYIPNREIDSSFDPWKLLSGNVHFPLTLTNPSPAPPPSSSSSSSATTAAAATAASSGTGTSVASSSNNRRSTRVGGQQAGYKGKEWVADEDDGSSSTDDETLHDDLLLTTHRHVFSGLSSSGSLTTSPISEDPAPRDYLLRVVFSLLVRLCASVVRAADTKPHTMVAVLLLLFGSSTESGTDENSRRVREALRRTPTVLPLYTLEAIRSLHRRSGGRQLGEEVHARGLVPLLLGENFFNHVGANTPLSGVPFELNTLTKAVLDFLVFSATMVGVDTTTDCEALLLLLDSQTKSSPAGVVNVAAAILAVFKSNRAASQDAFIRLKAAKLFTKLFRRLANQSNSGSAASSSVGGGGGGGGGGGVSSLSSTSASTTQPLTTLTITAPSSNEGSTSLLSTSPPPPSSPSGASAAMALNRSSASDGGTVSTMSDGGVEVVHAALRDIVQAYFGDTALVYRETLKSSDLVDVMFGFFQNEKVRSFGLKHVIGFLDALGSERSLSAVGGDLYQRLVNSFPLNKLPPEEITQSDVDFQVELLLGVQVVLRSYTHVQQARFLSCAVFAALINVITVSAAHPSYGITVWANVMATFTSLLADSSDNKANFAKSIGYDQLRTSISNVFGGVPIVLTFEALFDMMVDGPYHPTTRFIIANSNILPIILDHLKESSEDVRLFVVVRLTEMIEAATLNAMVCSDAGMMIVMINQARRAENITYVRACTRLIQLLGTHNITVNELKTLFLALKVIDGQRPRVTLALIEALQHMASRDSPDIFFDFDGLRSKILIPSFTFPQSKGYTFATWLKAESLGDRRGRLDHCPRLLSLRSVEGLGLEVFLEPGTLTVTSIGGGGKAHVAPFSVDLELRKWHHVVITHSTSKVLPYTQSEVKLYLNGELQGKALLKYPPSGDVLQCCAIGCNVAASVEESELHGESPFWGQLTSVFMFDDTLAGPVVAAMYALGPVYFGTFHSTEGKSADERFRVLFDADLQSKAVIAISSKACDGSRCINIASNTRHEEFIMVGMYRCVTKHIKDTIVCLGGVKSLFPILAQLDIPLQQHESDAIGPDSISAQVLYLLCDLLSSPANREALLKCNGFAIIGTLLQRASPQHITASLLGVVCLLVSQLTHARLNDDLYTYVLLDFRIWNNGPPEVRLGLLKFVHGRVFEAPQRFNALLGVTGALDLIHLYLADTPSPYLRTRSQYQAQAQQQAQLLAGASSSSEGGVGGGGGGGVSASPPPSSSSSSVSVTNSALRREVLDMIRLMVEGSISRSEVATFVKILVLSKDVGVRVDVTYQLIEWMSDESRRPPWARLLADTLPAVGGVELAFELLRAPEEGVRVVAIRLLACLLARSPEKTRKFLKEEDEGFWVVSNLLKGVSSTDATFHALLALLLNEYAGSVTTVWPFASVVTGSGGGIVSSSNNSSSSSSSSSSSGVGGGGADGTPAASGGGSDASANQGNPSDCNSTSSSGSGGGGGGGGMGGGSSGVGSNSGSALFGTTPSSIPSSGVGGAFYTSNSLSGRKVVQVGAFACVFQVLKGAELAVRYRVLQCLYTLMSTREENCTAFTSLPAWPKWIFSLLGPPPSSTTSTPASASATGTAATSSQQGTSGLTGGSGEEAAAPGASSSTTATSSFMSSPNNNTSNFNVSSGEGTLSMDTFQSPEEQALLELVLGTFRVLLFHVMKTDVVGWKQLEETLCYLSVMDQRGHLVYGPITRRLLSSLLADLQAWAETVSASTSTDDFMVSPLNVSGGLGLGSTTGAGGGGAGPGAGSGAGAGTTSQSAGNTSGSNLSIGGGGASGGQGKDDSESETDSDTEVVGSPGDHRLVSESRPSQRSISLSSSNSASVGTLPALDNSSGASGGGGGPVTRRVYAGENPELNRSKSMAVSSESVESFGLRRGSTIGGGGGREGSPIYDNGSGLFAMGVEGPSTDNVDDSSGGGGGGGGGSGGGGGGAGGASGGGGGGSTGRRGSGGKESGGKALYTHVPAIIRENLTHVMILVEEFMFYSHDERPGDSSAASGLIHKANPARPRVSSMYIGSDFNYAAAGGLGMMGTLGGGRGRKESGIHAMAVTIESPSQSPVTTGESVLRGGRAGSFTLDDGPGGGVGSGVAGSSAGPATSNGGGGGSGGGGGAGAGGSLSPGGTGTGTGSSSSSNGGGGGSTSGTPASTSGGSGTQTTTVQNIFDSDEVTAHIGALGEWLDAALADRVCAILDRLNMADLNDYGALVTSKHGKGHLHDGGMLRLVIRLSVFGLVQSFGQPDRTVEAAARLQRVMLGARVRATTVKYVVASLGYLFDALSWYHGTSGADEALATLTAAVISILEVWRPQLYKKFVDGAGNRLLGSGSRDGPSVRELLGGGSPDALVALLSGSEWKFVHRTAIQAEMTAVTDEEVELLPAIKKRREKKLRVVLTCMDRETLVRGKAQERRTALEDWGERLLPVEAERVTAVVSAATASAAAAGRAWVAIRRSVMDARGPWGTLDRKDNRAGWMLDPTESSGRMRRLLERNYDFTDHAEAAARRDSHKHGNRFDDGYRSSILSMAAVQVKNVSSEEDWALLGGFGDEEDILTDEAATSAAATGGEDDSTSASEKVLFTCEAERVILMGRIKGTLSITNRAIYFTPDAPVKEALAADVEARRKPAILLQTTNDLCYPLESVREIHMRRYSFRRSALELFFVDKTNVFINFLPARERAAALKTLRRLRLSSLVYEGSASPEAVLRKSGWTQKWQKRQISNFEYLMHLNTIAGRSFNDISQYPVFPWVIADYTSPTLDLSNPATYRDLSKPMGALTPAREARFIERYEMFDDPIIPKFHYGTHYSSGGFVLYYLIRLEPFTSLHVQLQSGKFDHADRMFHSVQSTWSGCTTSDQDVKELIPEWYFLPEMFINMNGFDLGRVSESETQIDHVILPPWAKDAFEFVRINRAALESEYVSANLHHWIDLIFGFKQRGPEALKATNVFNFLTYEGAIDIDKIDDPVTRRSYEDTIDNFGQTPSQLLQKPHPARAPKENDTASIFSQPNLSTLKAFFLQVMDEPLVHIGVPSGSSLSAYISYIGVPDRIVTVGGERKLASHRWLPRASVASGPAFTFELDPTMSASRRAGVPFACDIKASSYVFAVTNDGRVALSGGHWDNTLKATIVDTGKVVQSIEGHQDVVTCVAIDETGRVVVTGSRDSTVKTWDLNYVGNVYRVNESATFTMFGHDDAVTCVAINSDLSLVASGSEDASVILHSARTGDVVRSLYHPNGAPITTVVISHDGHIVCYAERDLNVLVFNLNGFLLLNTTVTAKIRALTVTLDCEHVIYGDAAGTVEVRYLHNFRPVYRFPVDHAICSVALSADERHLLVGNEAGVLLIFTPQTPASK